MRKFLLSSIALLMSVAMMAIGAGDGTSKANAIDFDWTNGNVHEASSALWYCVDLAPVNAKAEPALVLYLTNLSDEEAVVKVQIALAGKQQTATYTIAAKDHYRLDLPIGQFREFITLDQVSLQLHADQKMALSAKVYEFDEYVQEAIANSEPINWNSGAKQDALSTKWYEVDITSLKNEKQHLRVGFINHATDKNALLTATFVLRGENITLPLVVPAGFNMSKVLDYQLLAKLPGNRIHVGITTDSPIEVLTSTKNAIADDPTPCLNAIDAQHGVTYVHDAGTTQWYRISLDLLKSQADFSSFYLANKGNSTAHVTLGMVTDCQYTTGTAITLPIPTGFEIGALAPNILGNLINELTRFESLYNKVDAKDVYLEIHSDQPIHFGLDVTNATTNPCLREDLITFDWDNGAKVNAGDASWFDMDLTTVKESGKHVKLTFTNHTDSLVWAATVVSVSCPAKLTMPLIIPVPAGMSVDHVINYQLFAVADLYNIYIGVLTDGALELKAEMLDATVIPSADCLTAQKIVSGEEYVQNPGTKWYQFPMSLIDEMGDAAKLSFENRSSNHASLTAGVAVDCEYSPVTCAEVKLIKNIDLSLNMPKRIIAKLRGLIDPSLTDFYLQLTTDQTIAFSLNTQADGIKACASAVDFDWNAWEMGEMQLYANQDVWYKVDLEYPLQKLRNGEDIMMSLANMNDTDVKVSLSASPTCPVVLSIDKSINIPAHLQVQEGLAYVDIVKYVEQYDQFKELLTDPKKLVEKLETYAFYQKLQQEFDKYDRFVPYGQIEAFLGRYGEYISYTGVKELFNNYEKYLSVAEIKQQLALHKEYISYDEAVELLKAYDDYIPFVDAEQILAHYDLLLPYAGGVLQLLNKCKTYITKENLKQAIDYCMQYVPVDEIKQLWQRVEDILKQYLPADKAIYVNIKSDGDLLINADIVPETPTGCEDAELLDWTQTIHLSELKTGWYKFDISTLHATKEDFTLSLNNDLGTEKTLGFDFYKDCAIDEETMKEMYLTSFIRTFSPGVATTSPIPYSLVEMVASDIDMLYVYLTIDAKQPCEDAVLFDWNTGAYQDADTTVWYEFDITPVLNDKQQVKLTFTNHSNENAWVIAELALHCPYNKSIPLIVPVPAGMSVDKWIDYSVFEASRLKHCYLGVTTKEAAIELTATTENALINPSDGCLNATLVQNDSLYEHAAGTHWYKFTGDLFDGEGHFSRVRVVNRSAETVTITAGATVGCEYNIATRAMMKLPKRFDLAFAIPVWVVEQMKKFVDDDVKEFYMELTTDQPIAFSFGLEMCENAILFDWNTGHTQEALTNQWYEVNIDPVLANEQQIKLTLTNHSDQTAWVATLVSLDCPFKVALPLAFPIPAGMSVDKWIDYSYFAATRLDHIFVGVTTTEKISIKAEAQSAVITPTADCINATEILYGSTYVHEGGTAWYKVDGSLFADMDKLPKFQFSTVSGEKTNVTIGATVGCEYNIATRAKVPVPGDVEIAVRVPRFVFKVLREFVDYDVNEFYIELTTDKKVEFSVDATVEEDLDACLEAVDLVISDTMTIDLVADTDMWYKVDLSAVKDLNKDLAVTVTNAAAEAVEVEVEVSPTCPIAATVLKRFTAPASTTATTVLTAARINELLKEYPNIIYYVRVRATGDLHIEVSEPEVVEKEACEEAIEYVWGQPTVVIADSDVWYAIDITEAKAEGKDLFVTVKNIDDIAAVVSAEVLYDCPGVVQHSLTKTIGVGEALSTTLPIAEIQAIESNVLYLHLVTTGDIEVTVGEPEEVEEDACLQAIPLNWDEEVTVVAGDTVWYAVNIADAKALQKNIKLTVKNQSAESALVKADIAYDCPVTAFMHSMTKNIGAKMSITTTITYDRFANLETDVLYIRIITTSELLISAEIEEEPIEEETTCEDAIPYELGTVVSLPANADVWYAVNIAPAKANQSDLELIINNESELENEVSAQLSEECPVVDFLLEMSAVLEPLGTVVETASYDKYGTYADVIYLHIKTSDVLDFVLKEVRTKKYETLLTEAFVCDGTEFIDSITNEKHIISSLIASTQTWSDTVPVSEWLDSVYVYAITPIVAPTPIDETILASIPSATPQLTPGLVPNVLGSVEAIKDYYAANDNDTIADVDSVYWTEASLNTIVACEATTHTMTLVVEAGCDNRITSSLTFEVVQSTTPDSVEKVTICYGETYTWNGNIYSETGEYTITLSSITGCDSIATLNLTILPEIAETIIDTTICAGETYTWDANNMEYNTSATDTVVMQNAAGCDSVVILQLTVLPAIEETVEEMVICYGEKYLWNDEEYDATGSYTITLPSVLTGCDSVVTLNLLVLPATEYVEDNVVLCAGETYTWAANGVTYNRSINTTFKKKNQAGCDSIVYTLNLTILPANAETVEYATICHGDTYTWNGASYNVSDEYRLTLSDVNGCDSVAVLKLTVLPEAYTIESDTLVCDGESFTWFDQTCNEAKTYTHVVKNVLGCDSIIYTLNVSMLPAAYEVVEDTTICYGESITWNDQICSESKAYTHIVNNVLGCDSIIYTLNVTVLPEVIIENEELVICESEFPYEWRGEVLTQAGTYTIVEQFAATGCDSVIHTLNLQTYVLTAPATVAEIIAVCGNPIDVTAATADIEAHIASTNLYAPNAVVTWYVKDNGEWTALNSDPIKGSVGEVVLKYVISSDCGSIESNEFELIVEAPTPENDVDMDNVLAVSKYENRVFLLHLNDFATKFGWTPTPEEVTWYKVVNEKDPGIPVDDALVGTGHSYNEPDGSIIKPGEYYAIIVRNELTNPDECQTTMRTVVLTSGVVALSPQLIPNIARPNENLKLINLNPNEVTEIHVYSTTGELMNTYVAEQVAEFMFNAAHASGYYMVDVKTVDGKTTLRYVVK